MATSIFISDAEREDYRAKFLLMSKEEQIKAVVLRYGDIPRQVPNNYEAMSEYLLNEEIELLPDCPRTYTEGTKYSVEDNEAQIAVKAQAALLEQLKQAGVVLPKGFKI